MNKIDEIMREVENVPPMGTPEGETVDYVPFRNILEKHLTVDEELIEEVAGLIMDDYFRITGHKYPSYKKDLIFLLRSKLFGIEPANIEKLIRHLETLEYYHTTTSGLWATDKPEMLPEDLKKSYFWQIGKLTGDTLQITPESRRRFNEKFGECVQGFEPQQSQLEGSLKSFMEDVYLKQWGVGQISVADARMLFSKHTHPILENAENSESFIGDIIDDLNHYKEPDENGKLTSNVSLMIIRATLDNKVAPLVLEKKMLEKKLADIKQRDAVFIQHIQSHLRGGEEVICKICGKTAKEIIGIETLTTELEQSQLEKLLDSIDVWIKQKEPTTHAKNDSTREWSKGYIMAMRGVKEKIDSMLELEEEPTPIDKVETNLIEMLRTDNSKMRTAGCNMAIAGMRVVSEYDGCHRLANAISKWEKVIAEEGGRNVEPSEAKPATVQPVVKQPLTSEQERLSEYRTEERTCVCGAVMELIEPCHWKCECGASVERTILPGKDITEEPKPKPLVGIDLATEGKEETVLSEVIMGAIEKPEKKVLHIKITNPSKSWNPLENPKNCTCPKCNPPKPATEEKDCGGEAEEPKPKGMDNVYRFLNMDLINGRELQVWVAGYFGLAKGRIRACYSGETYDRGVCVQRKIDSMISELSAKEEPKPANNTVFRGVKVVFRFQSRCGVGRGDGETGDEMRCDGCGEVVLHSQKCGDCNFWRLGSDLNALYPNLPRFGRCKGHHHFRLDVREDDCRASNCEYFADGGDWKRKNE